MGLLSNYCGLGGQGIPQHTVDEICKEHDEDYAKIQAEHGVLAPYLRFNWADEKMMKKLSEHAPSGAKERILSSVAGNLWRAKQAVLPTLSNLPGNGQAIQVSW